MGAYGNPLDNATMMVAFHALARERCDLAAPLAVTGGHSLLWLIALMHSREGSAGALSPEMRVIYGGADLATYVASLSIYGAQQAPADQDARGVLSTSLAVFFDPEMQAGPVLWAALPFMETTTRIAPAPVAPGGAPVDPGASDKRLHWLTWLAVLVSVGLVLSAVVV
jgi:hypothetical protein